MAGLISDIKKRLKSADVVSALIYLNTAIFVVMGLMNLFCYLFNIEEIRVFDYGKLPAYLPFLLVRPWTLFTYMFIHVDVLHILFNMLFLYWFGKFFLYYFSSKQLRGLYILGGLFGALLYIVSYQIFPAFAFDVRVSNLAGASAAVLAIVIAVAVKAPNESVRFLLIGNIKLKYISLFVVLMDLLMITTSNGGGHIAHLGGALAGFLFVKAYDKGLDLTSWINSILDFPKKLIMRLKSSRKGEAKMKVVKGNQKFAKHKADHDFNYDKRRQNEEIDRILDKIKVSGYTNLTEKEKKTLFDASEK